MILRIKEKRVLNSDGFDRYYEPCLTICDFLNCGVFDRLKQ